MAHLSRSSQVMLINTVMMVMAEMGMVVGGEAEDHDGDINLVKSVAMMI